MNPISVTITGRLGDEPRTFTTHTGTTGVELRLALEVPSRIPGADSVTRWVKVIAFGPLAERTAASVGKGDRVTVIADDLMAEAWKATSQRRAAGPGHPAGTGHRRIDGLRPAPHRLRHPEGRPGRSRQRPAERPARWRAGRGAGPLRRHDDFLTPAPGGDGLRPVPAPLSLHLFDDSGRNL